MPPAIRIRIVAAVDASMKDVFNSLATSAKRAGKKIGDDLGAGAAAGTGPYRSMPARIQGPMNEAARSARSMGATLAQSLDGPKAKFQEMAGEERHR